MISTIRDIRVPRGCIELKNSERAVEEDFVVVDLDVGPDGHIADIRLSGDRPGNTERTITDIKPF